MTDTPVTSAHNLYSSYREMLGGASVCRRGMRFLWQRGNVRMEVLKPQVDDGGHPPVLQAMILSACAVC